MNNKGVLVVVSAPSGCGKDTIIAEVLKKTDDAFLSVSTVMGVYGKGFDTIKVKSKKQNVSKSTDK